MDLLITPRPRIAELVSVTVDETSGIKLSLIHFKNKGDFFPARGPASPEFFERGNVTSFNVFTKPWNVYFQTEDGNPAALRHKAFHNSNYSQNRSYGPFFLTSTEPDTHYFCVQRVDEFQPVEYEIVTLASGDTFELSKYKGWNIIVLAGSLGYLEFGSLNLITSDYSLMAKGETKIALVRKSKP